MSKFFIPLLFIVFCLEFLSISPVQAANCGTGIKACVCGDTLVTDYKMTGNLTCNGNGLTITNGATLSCGGSFSLIGTNKTGVGVTIPANQKGRVNNCKGDASSTKGIRNFKVGIHCDSCRFSTVQSTIVQDNGPANQIQGYGMKVTNGVRFTVRNSIIKNSGDEGIHDSNGYKNRYDRNVFTGNDVEGLYFFNTTRALVNRNKFISEVAPLYIKNSPDNLFRYNTTDAGLFQFIGSSSNNAINGGHYSGIKLTKTTDGTPSNLVGSYVHLFRVGGNNPCVTMDNSGTTTLISPIWGASCVPLSTCTGTCNLVVK